MICKAVFTYSEERREFVQETNARKSMLFGYPIIINVEGIKSKTYDIMGEYDEETGMLRNRNDFGDKCSFYTVCWSENYKNYYIQDNHGNRKEFHSLKIMDIIILAICFYNHKVYFGNERIYLDTESTPFFDPKLND